MNCNRPHCGNSDPLAHRQRQPIGRSYFRCAIDSNDLFERAGVRRSEADAGSSSERPQRATTHDAHPRHRVDSGRALRAGQQDNTGLTVNGLRATENNFQLDGAIYNDRFFDSVPILPNPDALQEFTIQSSNYSAEYGGAGALVQLSTRSGTNRIHGSAYEFLRNTVLNARNYFQQTPRHSS